MRNLLLASAALLAVYAFRRAGEQGVEPGAPTLPTAHFTLEELTTTGSGLRNVPTSAQKANLALMATHVLEPLRAQFGPLRVTRGFRNPAVNSAAGGSSTSAHMDGRAADLYSMAGKSAATMAAWLYDSSLPLNQVLIYWNKGHLHIARDTGGTPYRRDFKETFDGGKTWNAWKPGGRRIT